MALKSTLPLLEENIVCDEKNSVFDYDPMTATRVIALMFACSVLAFTGIVFVAAIWKIITF